MTDELWDGLQPLNVAILYNESGREKVKQIILNKIRADLPSLREQLPRSKGRIAPLRRT